MIHLGGPAETVGATGSLSLVSVADLQVYLDLPPGENDTYHQVLLDTVHMSAFRLMGGRFIKIPSVDFDEVVDIEQARRTLFLAQKPITSITAIDLGEMTSDGTFTSSNTLTTDEYYTDKPSGRIYTRWPGVWPKGQDIVRVRYKAGFSTVPADLKAAVCRWVSVLLVRIDAKNYHAIAHSSGNESTSFTLEEIPEASARVFEMYSLRSAYMPQG